MIAVVLQEHLHDVLSDVVDVPLDGGQDDGALVPSPLGQAASEHVKGGLHRLGGGHELGQEQGAPLIPLPHPVQSGDDAAVDDLQGLAVRQEGLHGGGDHLLPAADDIVLQRLRLRNRSRLRRLACGVGGLVGGDVGGAAPVLPGEDPAGS